MSVLEAHITAMSKEDLTAHIQDLQKFFLDGLNFRFLYCEVIRFYRIFIQLKKIVNDTYSSSYYYYYNWYASLPKVVGNVVGS